MGNEFRELAALRYAIKIAQQLMLFFLRNPQASYCDFMEVSCSAQASARLGGSTPLGRFRLTARIAAIHAQSRIEHYRTRGTIQRR